MRTNDEIIKILTDLKDEKRISISELARQVGMAKSAVSRYFNKTREFPLNRVNEFAKALGVTPEYILGFDTSDKDVSDIVEETSPEYILKFKTADKDVFNIVEETTHVMKQLNENNQREVYKYSKEKLNFQNKVIDKSEPQTSYVISKVAAGSGILNLDVELGWEVEVTGPVPEHDYAFQVAGNSMEPVFQDGEIIYVSRNETVRNGQIGVVAIDYEYYVKKMYFEENQLRLVSLNKEYKDVIADGSNTIKIIGRVIM